MNNHGCTHLHWGQWANPQALDRSPIFCYPSLRIRFRFGVGREPLSPAGCRDKVGRPPFLNYLAQLCAPVRLQGAHRINTRREHLWERESCVGGERQSGTIRGRKASSVTYYLIPQYLPVCHVEYLLDWSSLLLRKINVLISLSPPTTPSARRGREESVTNILSQ